MSPLTGAIALAFALMVFAIVAAVMWRARLRPRLTLPQYGVRALYRLACLFQAYAVAWDSAIIAYRDYMADGSIRPRNELCRQEDFDGAARDRA